ncbi:MAG: hypothetical protein O2816_07390 [Planctomycetota bacterium]|nr:hypothetical protein [Planctomycetota bacterium]
MATNFLLDLAVPDLSALGARAAEDLLGTGAALETEAQAERLPAEDGVEVLRVPLPGTLRGRPRGAGTGWVLLRRFHAAPLRARLAARFQHPRSDSLASREWNLYCALRAAGVVTPAPMALAHEVHPFFAKRSALVLRDLEGVRDARTWFAETDDPLARRRACLSLGLTLARLRAGNFDLPRLASRLGVLPEDDADRPDAADDACGLEQILAARTRSPRGEALGFARGLRWRRLPEIVVTDAAGGRIRAAAQRANLDDLRSTFALSRSELRRVVFATTHDAEQRRRWLRA